MQVSSCCGCCSVKTGVMIIGLLTVVCSVLSIIFTVVQAPGFFFAIYATPIIHFICGVMLVIGTQNRESAYIFPMVCTLFTSLILILPVVFVHIVQIGVLTNQTQTYYAVVFPIMGICFALVTYFFIVTNTFYKELLREKYTDPRFNRNVDVHYTNKPHY